MRSAKRSDKHRAVELLCLSFKGNLSVNFMVGSGPGQLFRTRKLMAYAFETCYQFGEVFLDEDKSAVALVTYPHLKRFSLYAVWLDLLLMFQVIGFSRLLKVLRREKLIQGQHPDSPYCYLWFIGVDPALQGKGIGTGLMAGVLAKMDAQNLPVYLETSVERNLLFYRKFAFHGFNRIDLGYLLYFLKRQL